MFKRKAKPQVVTSLVDANADYRKRMVVYTVVMLFRFVAIWLLFVIPFPWNVLPIVFSIVSPWFAVLFANNVDNTSKDVIVKPSRELN